MTISFWSNHKPEDGEVIKTRIGSARFSIRVKNAEQIPPHNYYKAEAEIVHMDLNWYEET